MSAPYRKGSSAAVAAPLVGREEDSSSGVAAFNVARNHTQVPRRVTVQEGHALWVQSYDGAPNPLLALEERELAATLPSLTGKFVLNVACGTGRWIEKLLARGARGGVGLDFTSEMLACAASRAPLRGRLVRADCLALPFGRSLFDFIICSFAAGYVEDLRALARELARGSRHGAKVVVSDFHPSRHADGWRRTFRHGDEVVEISSFLRPVGEVCSQFEAEGFSLRRRIEPCFGEPERAIFVEAGRADLFDLLSRTPAIFICQFELTGALLVGEF